MDLRPYQLDLIERIKSALRLGGPVLAVAPTGSGKTVIFAHIAQGAMLKSKRVIILTHRREIRAQTVATLSKLGVVCGEIAPGEPLTDNLIQVASIQTLVRKSIPKPDLIINDEAHHATGTNTLGKILSAWGDVPHIGFTATPERLDGVALGGVYKHMVMGPTLSELVDAGYLCAPVLYCPPVAATYHIVRGDYDRNEQTMAMGDKAIVGNVIDHYRKRLEGKSAICSCATITHAQNMAAKFREAGYRALAVWGDMPSADRARALSGLGDGSIQIVTFADLIGEGVDIPAVAGAILLRRTLSLSLYLQICGRVLRPVYSDGDLSTSDGRLAAQASGPKPRAIILDHAGNYKIHGHVLSERTWSLEGKRARGTPPPASTTCPKCYGTYPGSLATCPECGATIRISRPRIDLQEKSGELVETTVGPPPTQGETPLKRQRRLIGLACKLVTQGPRGFDQLAKEAANCGYSPSWVRWAWGFALQKPRYYAKKY